MIEYEKEPINNLKYQEGTKPQESNSVMLIAIEPLDPPKVEEKSPQQPNTTTEGEIPKEPFEGTKIPELPQEPIPETQGEIPSPPPQEPPPEETEPRSKGKPPQLELPPNIGEQPTAAAIEAKIAEARQNNKE